MSSCSNQDQISILHSSNIASDIISFPLDSTQSYKLRFITQYEEDGIEYFITLDDNHPAFISIYDLVNRNLLKKIPLTYDGPNGVGIPTGLVVVSLDSIYVISNYLISLVDVQGLVMDRHRTIEDGMNHSSEGGMLCGYTFSPCTVIDKHLYCPSIPDRNPFTNEFFDGYALMSMDTEEKDIEFKYSYPEQHKNDYLLPEMVFFGIAYRDSNAIFSFSVSDSLYIYNLHDNIKTSRYARSILADKPPNKYRGSKDLEERWDYIRTNRTYSDIIYDKYRQKFYRFVSHPLNEEEMAKNTQLRRVSIITFNKHFEIQSECMMESGRYDTNRYFCSKDGFYVSLMNDDSPYINEDKWYFQKIEL